jgi:regulator of ribonuclease activity A
MAQSTSDLYDRYGEQLRVLPGVFQDFGSRARFSGEVVTVRCFEDNSRVKELLSTQGAGKVLLVDGGASQRCALMGDLIAGQAVTHGWEGVVIYGFVRDRVALKALDLGIRALGATPRKSLRRGEGQTQLPIEIGGVSCRPGDRLVADEDGIVLLDAAAAT